MSKCVNAEEYTKWSKYIEEDMSEVGVEIVKTEEAKESEIKYLNINVSNSEVERNPDRVRLCADAGILEYVKPSGDAISRQAVLEQTYLWSKDEFLRVTNPFDYLRKRINDLPSVNPQEPIAQERYEDLCEYFSGVEDILKNRDDFKAWLGRVKWHIHKAEELYEKYEQEPKGGHWKSFTHSAYHGIDDDGEPIWREVKVYHCNLCNRRTVIKENYCPNCGAKMVEPQEGEDEE